MDLHASSWKSQISASMFPNFVTKFLLKSTSKCLPNDMIIRFFGYVVLKISIMEDYVPELNYNENLIEFYENCIFHAFLMNLNASTSKSQISASVSPRNVRHFEDYSYLHPCGFLSRHLSMLKDFTIKTWISMSEQKWSANILLIIIHHRYFGFLSCFSTKWSIWDKTWKYVFTFLIMFAPSGL